MMTSRRKFLTNIVFGSLLALAGTNVVNARVKHFASRKIKQTTVAHKTKPTKGYKERHTRVTTLASKKHKSHTLVRHSHQRHHIKLAHEKTHEFNKQSSVLHSENNFSHNRDFTAYTREDRHAMFRRLPSKAISLINPHTGDRLRLTYFERGLYIEDALQEIDYIFRDYHTGDIHPIDPTLLDLLYDLKQELGVSRPFNIISGYRSPITNANLRRHSDGVAKHSLHMQGRAVDIRLDNYSTRTIRDAALAMQRGGVGYYPDSNFVHLDTGNIRTWSL